jgi:hypothetical protein
MGEHRSANTTPVRALVATTAVSDWTFGSWARGRGLVLRLARLDRDER